MVFNSFKKMLGMSNNDSQDQTEQTDSQNNALDNINNQFSQKQPPAKIIDQNDPSMPVDPSELTTEPKLSANDDNPQLPDLNETTETEKTPDVNAVNLTPNNNAVSNMPKASPVSVSFSSGLKDQTANPQAVNTANNVWNKSNPPTTTQAKSNIGIKTTTVSVDPAQAQTTDKNLSTPTKVADDKSPLVDSSQFEDPKDSLQDPLEQFENKENNTVPKASPDVSPQVLNSSAQSNPNPTTEANKNPL